jgi:hypothetical protein
MHRDAAKWLCKVAMRQTDRLRHVRSQWLDGATTLCKTNRAVSRFVSHLALFGIFRVSSRYGSGLTLELRACHASAVLCFGVANSDVTNIYGHHGAPFELRNQLGHARHDAQCNYKILIQLVY